MDYYYSKPLCRNEFCMIASALTSSLIFSFVFSKKELTYLENKYLFSLEVLESDEYLNDNIEGRYFKKDFDM